MKVKMDMNVKAMHAKEEKVSALQAKVNGLESKQQDSENKLKQAMQHKHEAE